ICDIDHFKAYNDGFGHPAGDQALRAVAGALASGVRPSDSVYRWGGEEFLVLLPEQDATGGLAALGRLRRAVRDLGIPHPRSAAGVVTLSVGLTVWGPGRSESVDQLVAEADRALYAAKEQGRDQVCLDPAGLAPRVLD
ncbi:MAG TPA: GGDEF domain-containing protein, partial [Kineosporiaceae bacterium]|nr:GGDEF domain-containing protein [Kineosporiaceae bacterium]